MHNYEITKKKAMFCVFNQQGKILARSTGKRGALRVLQFLQQYPLLKKIDWDELKIGKQNKNDAHGHGLKWGKKRMDW